MARPTKDRLNAGPDFTPETREAPSLGVFSSLDVRAAPSGAEQLAQALGLVNQVAQPALARAVEKDSFERTEAGKNAAVIGSVDEKREKEDNLYARGVKFATKERAVRNVLAEVDRAIAQEGADLGPEERAARRDELLREHLGDMVNDPESAGIAAKLIEPWTERNRQADNLEVIKEAEQATVEAEGQNIKDAMADGTFDYASSIARLAPVVGRERAVEIVVGNVGAAAVNLRDETLIDKVLPETIKTDDGQTIDGPRKAQKHQELLDRYRVEARKARLEDAATERRVSKSEEMKGWIIDPASFTTRDYDRLIREVDPRYTADEAEALLAASKRARESAAGGADLSQLRTMNPNMRLRLFLGVLAGDGDAISSEDLQKQANREIEATTAATGRPVEEVASEFSAVEGFVYQPIANDLQKIPPSDTQLWPKAVEQFFKLSPKVRELYVPDADKRALFERSQAFLAAGKKPTEVGTMLDQQSADMIRANRAAVADKWNKKLDSLRNREVNDGGLLGLSTTVGQLSNAPVIATEIRKRAQVRVDNGADPDTALEAATQEVVDGFVFVSGPDRTRSMLLPRGGGVTDSFSPVVSWFYQNLPAFVKARGYDVDPSKVRLTTVPGSDQNTVLSLVDEDGMPVDLGLRLDPAGMTADYTRATQASAYAAAQEVQRRVRKRRENQTLSDPTLFIK